MSELIPSSAHFADRLLGAVAAKNSVVCVGIDPMPEFFPNELLPRSQDPRDVLDCVFRFCQEVLRAVEPFAACVKFQSAYFEVFHGDGVEAYHSLVQEAADLGMVTIGDVKRGDIGTTSAAYARAHLAPIDEDHGGDGDLATPDAITISPFLGLDTIDPFIAAASEHAKGLFVLVRTSNPGSSLLQDAMLADGRTVSEKLADELSAVAAKHLGQSGYSSIGAVVGATQPQTMVSLRKRLPQSLFLLPGYGAQGATADMTRSAFTGGQGAVVSASRSVLYAHRETKYSHFTDFRVAIAQAAKDMRSDLNNVLGRA